MFSIVAPLDSNRLEQFKIAKRVYDEFPQTKEFILPTRNEFQVARYLDDHKLMKDVRLIPYTVETDGFNCSKALNIGVRNAKYDQIIITSPEVKPSTDVLDQLEKSLGENIICQVDDQDENGNVTPLVTASFRGDSPAMYFLAMFNKRDIESINGWDEEFMKGYAYEDNDFGERWKRAGLPFTVREDIKGLHLYHPRTETIPGGTNTNFQIFSKNNADGIIRCIRGLEVVE